MAILGDTVEAIAPFDRYPAGAYPTEIVAVAFMGGKWYGLTNFVPPRAGRVQIRPNGALRYCPSAPAAGSSPSWCCRCVYLDPFNISAFGRDDEIDLFWLDSYLPWMAFPDSGQERQRMWHGQVRPGELARPTKIWDLPGPHSYCEYPIYIRVGQDRYDVLYTCLLYGLPHTVSRDLMYLRDVLHPDLRGPQRSVSLEYSSCEAVVLPQRRVVALWFKSEPQEYWKRLTVRA